VKQLKYVLALNKNQFLFLVVKSSREEAKMLVEIIMFQELETQHQESCNRKFEMLRSDESYHAINLNP
jgi:hypothetical protein